MSCNIRVIEGKEVGFTDQGTVSSLYKEAVNKLGEEKGKEVFLVSLSDDFKETIPPQEVINPKKVAEKYTRLITSIKESDPEQYWSVDIPSPEDVRSAAEEGRIVDVKGGMGIVTKDGNMVGLFKYDSSQTGTAAAVQEARIKMGGIKLDNFDGYLTKTYKKNGFRVAARIPFNEEYAPEGWNKEAHGTPDVVFMVYDPNSNLDIEEKTFEDYEEAQAYRDSFVEEAKAGHPFYSVNPATSSNSDISPELKQEYKDIVGAPSKKRESFKVEEPSLESVMQYITSQNESTESMNDEQVRDFKNMLLSVKGFTVEKLKKAFYDENGIFIAVPSKLTASGIYTQYEAEHLAKDLELQDIVKKSLEALKNTEDVISAEQDFEQVEKENKFTSFGKLNNLNPYIVEKQIQNTLAASTREEFDELIGELPFVEFQKSVQSETEKDRLFNDMQSFKKAEMLLEVGGEIKPSLNSNTEVVVLQVAKSLRGKKVLSDIAYIMQQDLSILKARPDSTRTLLKQIEKGLINEGYDVIGLPSKETDVYLMEYLSAVTELSETPSQETLDEYVRVYNSYFEQDLTPEKGFVKTEQDDRDFVKLDTTLTEEEVYNQQGLIKQGDGLYIRVNKKSADELYPILITYPEKLPEGVKTEEQLRKYVQSNVKNDEVTSTETAEVLDLFKMYFSIPAEAAPKKVDKNDFNQKQAQFTGDVEYLATDFVSDFYIEGLKEKAKESDLYRDFYRHFSVTSKGLELVNNDPITLEVIKPYVTEDLKNYSLLSRSMPNLKGDIDFVDSRNSRRSLVSNHPAVLEKFQGNISILDNNNIIAKNDSSEFIKLKNAIYENVGTIGNLSLYTKLETSKGEYNNFAVDKPVSSYNLNDYLHLNNEPENFVNTKNYLSKGEKEDLDSDQFACL